MGSGGRRQGAGRPLGTGRYDSPTKAIRVPAKDIEKIMHMVQHQCYRMPFFECNVAAGFPSPADSDRVAELDLNDLLIKHPVATFFVRVAGSSMIKAGIHHQDILVVDRSLEPVHGKIVIASVNGELTVKRLSIQGKTIRLVAENDAYIPIDITEGMELHIWGVVTNVIHSL